MSAERSGEDRRHGWGPQCENHGDLLTAVVSLKTTVRIVGSIVVMVVGMGSTVLWRTGDRAIRLADKVASLGTDLELSKQDRRVIREELRVLSDRITRLEQSRGRDPWEPAK